LVLSLRTLAVLRNAARSFS